jgi:parvulin-like peptidyl-prolyl isomerase
VKPAPTTNAVKPAAAKPVAKPAAAPVPDGKVVLTIGTEKVTDKQFDAFVDALPDQIKAQAKGPMKRQVAEQLVRVRLLADEAKKRGLDKDPSFQAKAAFQYENMLAGALFADMQTAIKSDDAALKKYYDEHKQEIEFVQARHILVKYKGSPVPNREGQKDLTEEEALAKATELRKKILAGEDFAKLAKAESDDVGSGAVGGDLGNFKHGQMVPAFEAAAFAAKVNEVTEPVKTQFGYHIIRLDEVQAGKTKSFESVRPELEAELKRNAAADKFGEIQEQIQSRLEQAGGDLGVLAKEFNLQTGEVSPFLRGQGGAPLGTAQPIQDIVFGDSPLQPGRIGGPVLVGEDRLVLVKVTEHNKPQPKPVAEVRDGIVAAVKKDRGSAAALKAAQDGQSKLQAGTSFDDVAKQLGVSSEPARFVGRADSTIPAQLRELVFNSPKPTDKPVYRAVALQTGGAAVVAVTQLRTESPEADKSKQADQIKQQNLMARQDAARHGQADAAAYVEEMRRTADVRKNPKAFE